MTEEEMRAKIVELETSISDKDKTIEVLQTKTDTDKTTIETLNTTVSTLKQQNYDLFMKVPHQSTEPKKEEIKQDVKSLDDLTNILMGV